LDRDEFRRACARFATGVCVLTACTHDGSPQGLTLNSFTSLSLDPPLVMAAIAAGSIQREAFERTDFFAVNILAEDQQHLSAHFSIRQEGRFQGIAWRPGVTGSPVFEDTLGAIECKAIQRFDAGDHRVLVGEAVAAAIREGRPLVYFRSAYATLG
jgi:3-hydroxy-9,10-secoandrosta-1,3,5(10)-triene-9,17-dione monooxygenase reductase component